MRIRQTLTLRPADLRRFTRFHPDHRISAGDIGKFELVDTHLRVFRLLRGGVVEGSKGLSAAALLEPGVLVLNRLLLQLCLAILRRRRMPRYRRIPLADVAGLLEDLSDCPDLIV